MRETLKQTVECLNVNINNVYYGIVIQGTRFLYNAFFFLFFFSFENTLIINLLSKYKTKTLLFMCFEKNNFPHFLLFLYDNTI